jgi:hypothetical protein
MLIIQYILFIIIYNTAMPRQSRKHSTNSAERRLIINKELIKGVFNGSNSTASSPPRPWWKRYFGCFSRSCSRRSPSRGGNKSKYNRLRSKTIKETTTN